MDENLYSEVCRSRGKNFLNLSILRLSSCGAASSRLNTSHPVSGPATENCLTLPAKCTPNLLLKEEIEPQHDVLLWLAFAEKYDKIGLLAIWSTIAGGENEILRLLR